MGWTCGRRGGGWRLVTRDAHAPYVEKLLADGARSRLTRAALETLAVVAYRQPVTRARVSAVRGVNVDGVVRTLLARGLLVEAGTDPETHAVRYATTELFLERLGLSSLAQLPPLAPLLPEVELIEAEAELDGVTAAVGDNGRRDAEKHSAPRPGEEEDRTPQTGGDPPRS